MKNGKPIFFTDDTFSKEFNFLKDFNPYALEDKCRSFDQILPQGFLETITGDRIKQDTIFSSNFNFHIQSQDAVKLLEVKNYDFNFLLSRLEGIGSVEWDESITNRLMSLYGTDTFGMYLSFHNYHNCRWGIYLFPEIIYHHSRTLFERFKRDDYTFSELLIMYFFSVYRHELFHYQTERYATKLELITHQAHYKGLAAINDQVRNTENWLEEALAEATVLDSFLVSNRSRMSIDRIRKVYKYDLQNMPPGYRDYHCDKYGGHHSAHLYFASQIKEMKVKPGFKLPDLFTVKGEFSSNDLSVPLYFVTGFNGIERIR